MRPLADMPLDAAAGVRCVLTDIDDTLTSDGRLPAAAYTALERLAQAGLAVVAVTGRPAGWCDLIARFWPVAGVVGENGAFWFAYDHRARRMRREYAADAPTRAAHRERLARIRERVLAEVPACAVASDQAYRETDLAIDIAEDVAPLAVADVDRVKAVFKSEGATAKVSSVHVNGWYGRYDKLATTRRFAAAVLDMDLDVEQARCVYCGDSPNDAPMFAFFEHGCGVANVADFAGRMPAEPAWVTSRRGGDGFVEIAAHLLAARDAQRSA